MTVSRISHDKRPSNQLQHFPLKQWWTFGTVYTINKIILILPTLLKFYWDSSSAECYSVLCPFLTKMSVIYRWNQHQMFYLQSSLDVAYHISMRIYKLFNLASTVLCPFWTNEMQILRKVCSRDFWGYMSTSFYAIGSAQQYTNYLRMRRQIVVKIKVLQFTS